MRIGEFQNLIIKRESPYGLYLTDGEREVLLPENQCPDDALVDQSLKVFLYTDSEDRMIATRMKPHAVVGEFAYLQVVSTTDRGAFFDWGLQKDLFCPFRQQHIELREGQSYIVRVYLDDTTQRVVCTTRWGRYLEVDGSDFQVGEPVRILVADKTPDFITAIVDQKYKGAFFPDEWNESLVVGSKHRGFIKRVRGDGKVALSLRPQGYEAVLGERDRLLHQLRLNGGLLRLSDKSSPEVIQQTLGLSKGAFKKLIGSLYREGIIVIDQDHIRMK
jgi:uncharacterized protein